MMGVLWMHSFYVQGTFVLFNDLCSSVVYLKCYLICFVLLIFRVFIMYYFISKLYFCSLLIYYICNVLLMSLYRGPLCKAVLVH